MDNILNYPTSTHVDRLVPKTAFYKHLEINTRLKMRFVEDVERIQWLYKLAPSTMNVDTGKTVHEIVMFLVTLKADMNLPGRAVLEQPLCGKVFHYQRSLVGWLNVM